MSRWNNRYYKRVIQSAHTRCWGVLLAFGLQLPAATPLPPPSGQNVPAAVTRPAAPPSYSRAWTEPVPSAERLLVDVSTDFVFTAGDDVPLEARALATGKVVWTHELTTWESLVAAETLVLGVSDGHVYALDAATGQTRWITQTTGPNTKLSLVGNQVLLVSDHDILLRDLSSGTGVWHTGLPAPPATAPASGETSVAVPLRSGAIISFDRATGVPRWMTRLDAPAVAAITTAPATYVGLTDGSLCMLHDRDGRRGWCYPLRVPVTGPPLVADQFVYVTLLDSTLRAIDRHNGAMRRQDPLGHRPGAGPWLTDTAIIVGLTTGEFLILNRTTGRRTSRVSAPGGGASQLLEHAVVSPTGHALVSLTILPGGQRRLSVFRPRPDTPLPITKELPPFPGPSVELTPPGPAKSSTVPRAFPQAR